MEKALENTLLENKKWSFKKDLFFYTILFTLTALGVYLAFIVTGRSLLPNAPGNFDGFGQAYPIYSKIKHEMASLLSGGGMDSWSWDVGLGSSFFDTFRGRLLNPITYLIAIFPQEHLDIAYSFFAVFRQYLTGVAFLAFTREVGFGAEQRIAGSLCYSFAGWTIVSTVEQADFNNATIFFPLLILGTERILKNKSPLVFIIAIALTMTSSKLWVYISAISVVLFFLVRYPHYAEYAMDKFRAFFDRRFIFSFLKYSLYGITGILISAICLMSILYTTSSGVIDTNVEKYGILYPIKDYLLTPGALFYQGAIHTPYSVIFQPVLVILLLPLTLSAAFKKKSAPAILFLFFFVISFFPVTGKFFNGFSYVVSRWFYVLAFFMVWAAVECYNSEYLKSKRNLLVCFLWMAALGVYNIGVCYFVLGIMPRNMMLSTVIGLFFGLIILGLIYVREFSLPRISNKYITSSLLGLLVIIITIGATIGAGNMRFYPGVDPRLFRYDRIGEMYDKFNSLSSQHIVPDIQNADKGFFRTDQVDTNNDYRMARVLSNMNIYSENRSIYEYFSSTNSMWFKFNKLMGNNAGYFDRTCVYSNDNRAALDYLMGVKYFIGDSKIKKPGANDYAPYGYSYDKTIDGIQVLKNKYCMGLGTTYDTYITESELQKFAPLEREQVLMQTACVPDNTDKAALKGLKHADLSQIKTAIRQYSCTISNPGKDIKLGNKTIEAFEGKDRSFDLTLPKIENAQVILSFENFTREKCDYDASLHYKRLPENKSFLNRNAYLDNQRFNILVSKGNVNKDTLNEKGKNQGFSDVKDFNINLGYYEEIDGTVKVRFSNFGKYTYDAIKVYAMPMDIYAHQAQVLDERSLKITSFENENIKGTVDCHDNSLLYLSILRDPGWQVYVDGKEKEIIPDTNIAFTGVNIPAGKHSIELKYKYPGLLPGAILTLVGLCLLVIIMRKKPWLNKTPISKNS